jgi:hypothetical protein
MLPSCAAERQSISTESVLFKETCKKHSVRSVTTRILRVNYHLHFLPDQCSATSVSRQGCRYSTNFCKKTKIYTLRLENTLKRADARTHTEVHNGQFYLTSVMFCFHMSVFLQYLHADTYLGPRASFVPPFRETTFCGVFDKLGYDEGKKKGSETLL